MFCCLCHAVPQNTAVPGMRRAQGGSSLQGVELCPTLSVQGSQPSTASPFKQDVFIYSASPGSDSPSVGAAATPVIMSRSPTGGFWGSLGWGQLGSYGRGSGAAAGDTAPAASSSPSSHIVQHGALNQHRRGFCLLHSPDGHLQ